jgi:hypothetical protein
VPHPQRGKQILAGKRRDATALLLLTNPALSALLRTILAILAVLARIAWVRACAGRRERNGGSRGQVQKHKHSRDLERYREKPSLRHETSFVEVGPKRAVRMVHSNALVKYPHVN